MNFLQQLKQANYQSTAIISEQDSQTCFAELIEQALQLRLRHPNLQQQSIALHYNNLTNFTVALLAFDGWCNALYLMPEPNIVLPEKIIKWPIDFKASIDNSPVPSTDRIKEHHKLQVKTQWYLATSGTTGTPKWIAHDFNSLSRAIKTTPHTTTLHWALCYQATRFAGLQVLLQSVLSGAIITDCSVGEPEQRIALMQKHAINAISATPSLWRQLLMTGQLSSLALEQITLGGEIADQPLLDTLAKLFPKAKLLHIYASTEAGVGFAVADKQAGFPVKWLTQGANGLSFKVDTKQHLWIKTPDSVNNARVKLLDKNGFIDSGDLVLIKQDRVLFLGRASGIINVGGNKVYPEQVEQVILQHPAVLQTKVYAKASSVLGQLVVADIVICNTAKENLTTLNIMLIKHCQQHLARYQVPTRFNVVTTLNTNASGKLSRLLKSETENG